MADGYTRQDQSGSIANGNVVDATDLNTEFDTIADAFNASTGHNHDGTAGGGATINSLGPSSDFVVSATEIKAKTPSTLSVGTSGVPFLDGHFDGTLNTDILSVDETSTFTGEITATGGLTGNVTGDLTGDVKNSDGTIVVNVGSDSVAAVYTGNVTGNLTGDVLNSDSTIVLDVGTDSVTAVFTGNVTGNATSADEWSTARSVSFATGDVTGSFTIDGSADVTDIDLSVASSLTTDLIGDVYASNGTSKILESGTDGSNAVLTGTVSSISNHDTDDLSEGSTNLYYTDARVDSHLNISTATNNQLLSWTGTDYDWIDAGNSANYYLDGATWNSGTGVLTLQVSGSDNVTVDLDGRYAEGTIPTNTNQLTNGAQYITSAQVGTIPTDTNQLANSAQYITSAQVGTIPTQTSQLSNDSQFATTAQVPAAVTNNNQLTNGALYATTSQVPTNNTQLQNGAGYITSATPPTTNGAVGTYIWGRPKNNTVYSAGNTASSMFHTVSGGAYWSNSNNTFYEPTHTGTSIGGTWRAMTSTNTTSVGLWVRIS